MQARRPKVRPTGKGGFKGIWRGGEKKKTKSPAAEGSLGCSSVPSTDTHTLAASQGPTFVLRGRHWQARSLILRDSARSVLDSALRGRRSTQRVNPSPAASQSQGDLGPRSSSRPCPSLRPASSTLPCGRLEAFPGSPGLAASSSSDAEGQRPGSAGHQQGGGQRL